MVLPQPVLGSVLDQLDQAGEADMVSVAEVVETIGPLSFAALLLIFTLAVVSHASAVPGGITVLAALEFILVAQMIAGRRHLWLPGTVSRRNLPGERLRDGVDRLRRPRMAFLTEKPSLYPWPLQILALTLFMPLMELVPASGTLASSIIALIAGRDAAASGRALPCGIDMDIGLAGQRAAVNGRIGAFLPRPRLNPMLALVERNR